MGLRPNRGESAVIRFVMVLLLALSANAWAGTYKWVDDKGITHYSDLVPPEDVNKATSKLDKGGRVTSRTRAAATEAERRALEEEETRKHEEEQKALEQKRRDKALIDTYNNEKEIDLARDRNLQSAQLLIDSTHLRIKSIQGRLDELHKQSDRLTKNKRPLPTDLVEDVKGAEGEIRQLHGNIAKYKQEMDDIRARFEDDRKRYRELRTGSGLLH
jgi:hypothetical protein